MRLAIASIIFLAAAGPALGATDRPTELCELEVQVTHSPYLMQFGQEILPGGISQFTCTLSTRGLALSREQQRHALEPLCRSFIAEAMAAATKCTGATFSDTAMSLQLQQRTGADINGPFFRLAGSSLRGAP